MTYQPPPDPSAKPPFFHVGIGERYRVAENHRVRHIGKLDLTYEELERQFLIPYQRRENILIHGITLGFDKIRQIVISQSDESAGLIRMRLEIRAKERAKRSGNKPSTVNSWDIARNATVITDEILGRVAPAVSQQDRTPMNTPDPRRVFVVSGRDSNNHEAMFTFLQSLDLNPIEFRVARRMTGRPSPYIGEILDVAFSEAQAIIVLMTPDDEARLLPQHETDLSGQARPNVLFEAGMAMGRDPDRTVLVEIGKLRPFSDISGLHILRFDDSSQVRQELAQRLEDAGCQVDVEGTHWHTAGNFDIP
ncbi:MAG: nucleotide-binding protein [Chloroflexota bacterium]|nr:nucleotide-binding protein [Chloroflexota bacterium]